MDKPEQLGDLEAGRGHSLNKGCRERAVLAVAVTRRAAVLGSERHQRARYRFYARKPAADTRTIGFFYLGDEWIFPTGIENNKT